MQFSASGTIVGTAAGDSASVTSTSGAGELQKLEFYMGESDSDEDDLKFIGGAGKTLITIHHFESDIDEIDANDQGSSNLTQFTYTTAQAASLIADALGLSSDPSESDVQHGCCHALLGSAVWTYNNDSYYVGGDTDEDGVFDDGESYSIQR